MPAFDRAHDIRVRTEAFQWLAARVAEHGDVLPRDVLARGFTFQGRRVPLLGPQGIFKPAVMEVPLSITTAPNGPYDDAFGPAFLSYRYRGTDPDHPDNAGLRFAMARRLPLAYLHGVVPGRYVATWPVYIQGDDPRALTFQVSVDDLAHANLSERDDFIAREGTEARRRYVTSLVRGRLHQRAFRERVLRAYRHQCSLCRLRHDELLDAAHIIPDREAEGEPVVSNGLALCRLHHAAFDRFFLGVRPDYVIEVRSDILRERDGPTLMYAIQGLHGQPITVPRRIEDRPAVELLGERYDRFLRAAS
ncbi:MAG TPA: HNH endonuclease [Longimicrobiales bacterium]|jgi:putative restriction endonuclease